MTHFKLLEQIERDIRNQVLFDSWKRLNRKQRTMVFARRNSIPLIYTALAVLWILACLTGLVRADELKAACPTPGEMCKVLYLTPQEEQMLMRQNGILDTAAQARSLDLGQFSVYFKTRIAGAQPGEIRPLTKEVPAPAGEMKPVDPTPAKP